MSIPQKVKQRLAKHSHSHHTRKSMNDINMLSPTVVGIEDEKEAAQNHGKISISTFHQHAPLRSPSSSHRGKQRPNPFLSPNSMSNRERRQSLMSSNSAAMHVNRLFSPSQLKSHTSMSTASPNARKFRFLQKSRSHLHSPNHAQITTPQPLQKRPSENVATGTHLQTPPATMQRRRSLDIKEIVIASRFRLIKKLGKGSFGVAYQSLDLVTERMIAIKLERKRDDRHASAAVNTREISILQRLSELSRVPTLIWHGQYKQYRVMALELQGMNLSDLYEKCGREFSLRTAIFILVECLRCMQQIHSRGIVHRDIKPQNFIISRAPGVNAIHVIDFGLSSWFLTAAQGVQQHIPYSECSPVGTARYASIHNHRGVHQTRRDDLESIGYMVVFFLKGELPWQGIKEARRVKKWRKIKEKKVSVANSVLTAGLPMEFCYYMDRVKKLSYDEEPNYAQLIRVFKKLYVAEGYYAQDMHALGKPCAVLDAELDFDIADLVVPDWNKEKVAAA